MTTEEIRQKMHQSRAGAWMQFRMVARATPEELRNMGFRKESNAEALLATFQRFDRQIENDLRKWEKENP